MPQLDFSTAASQLFWLIVMFALLYIVVSRIAIPRIGGLIEERQRRIDDNLDRAAKLKAEADTTLAAYEKALAEARAQSQAILRDMSERMAKQSEARLKELGDRLAVRIAEGDAQITAAKEAAKAQLRDIAGDLAKSVVEKLAPVNVDAATASNEVAALLKAPH